VDAFIWFVEKVFCIAGGAVPRRVHGDGNRLVTCVDSGLSRGVV